MIKSFRCVVGIAALIWCPHLSAQYLRSPADTVRVREVTTGSMSVTTPTGVIDVRSEHDAVVALAFGRADSARAWYESLRIAVITPQGKQEPASSAALHQPFELRFDERGRIETIRAPQFPAAFEGVSDLSQQFDDLFLRLPSRPLGPGVEWTDTAIVEASGPDRERSRAVRHISSRVARDTTVDGESAWVIESVQRLSLTSTQRMKDQPLTAHTRLTGADSGVFVFSQERGRMLGRQRSGNLSGTLTYDGGPQPMVFPVRQRYENTVTRVPDDTASTLPIGQLVAARYDSAFAALVGVAARDSVAFGWLQELARFKSEYIGWAVERNGSLHAVTPAQHDAWLVVVPSDDPAYAQMGSILESDPGASVRATRVKADTIAAGWAAVFLAFELSHLRDDVLRLLPSEPSPAQLAGSTRRAYGAEYLAVRAIGGPALDIHLDSVLTAVAPRSVTALAEGLIPVLRASFPDFDARVSAQPALTEREEQRRAGVYAVALLLRYAEQRSVSDVEFAAALQCIGGGR